MKPIKIPHEHRNSDQQMNKLNTKLKSLYPNKPSGIFLSGVELGMAQYTIDIDSKTNEVIICVPDDAKVTKDELLGV